MAETAEDKKHRSYRAHLSGAAVSVRQLVVAFDGNRVVDNVSFKIPAGKITAIIGPNGSGKTTLLKAILGLVPVQKGKVTVLGKPLDAIREHVGYVPQRFLFDVQFPITVEEFLQLALHQHTPKEHIQEKLLEVGLHEEIGRKILGQLSGGQLQRVLIARSILNNPDLLLLDEPSAGIDIVGESTFYGIIKHLNETHDTSVVLVSHEIDVVSKFVDEVLCFNNKLVCQGTPKEAFTKKNLEELYGKQTALYKHAGISTHKETSHHS